MNTRSRSFRVLRARSGRRGSADYERSLDAVSFLVLGLAVPLGVLGGPFALAHAQSEAPAVAIVSTPILSGVAGEPWQYDEDGLPDAVGVPPLIWSLRDAPEGARISNKTGEIYWLPMDGGSFSLTLVITDANGAEATQTFVVEVTGPTPPSFTLEPPADGYELEVYQMHWLTEGPSEEGLSHYVLPHTGTEPIYFSSNDTACMVVLADGTYAISSPIEQTCEVQILAANEAGTAELSLVLSFVSRYGEDEEDCLTADRTTGTAPMRVRISGEACVPSAWNESDWATRFSFSSGEIFNPLHEIEEPVVEHVYERPGTYQVRYLVWGNYLDDNRWDVPASLSSLPWFQKIADAYIGNEANLTITVLDIEERQPPSISLTADMTTGEPPLAVTFKTETQLGDGDIVHFELQFGDGNHFNPTIDSDDGHASREVQHLFGTPGYYQAWVQVLDSEGLTARAALDIIVTDRGRVPPYGFARATPGRGEAPLSVALVAEVGDQDGYVVDRYWQLHDGSTSASDEPQVTLEEPGRYAMKLVVQDDDGLSSVSVAVVEVTRDGTLPATIVSAPVLTAWVDRPYSYDSDGLPLATGGAPYVWALGLGPDATLPVAPEGMEIDERTGALTWTPTEEQVGAHPVRITVENVAGADSQQFVVEVQAPAPLPDPSETTKTQRNSGCAAVVGRIGDAGHDGREGSGATSVLLWVGLVTLGVGARFRARGRGSKNAARD